jgi:hypothetical protein
MMLVGEIAAGNVWSIWHPTRQSPQGPDISIPVAYLPIIYRVFGSTMTIHIPVGFCACQAQLLPRPLG